MEPSPAAGAAIELRRYAPADEPAVLELLQASLGWVPDDAYARFFRWKHVENVFGPSPAWVAVEPGNARVVGLRVFLRWEFARAGRVERAVRAVDTATHPDFRRRGIFSRLTRHALEELRDDGVAFVFNTPNDQSRPGYLKMGWRLVGRLPALARPRSPAAVGRLVRARTPAEKWSVPTDAGLAASEALADFEAIDGLLDRLPPPSARLVTNRSTSYLRWRYGFPPLAYRAMTAPDGPAGGLVLFRLRRRGPALEAAVCEELVPPESRSGSLLREVLRATGADHAVRLTGPGGGRRAGAGFVPVPGQGPTLVWRGVAPDAVMPARSDWGLTLGDVELF